MPTTPKQKKGANAAADYSDGEEITSPPPRGSESSDDEDDYSASDSSASSRRSSLSDRDRPGKMTKDYTSKPRSSVRLPESEEAEATRGSGRQADRKRPEPKNGKVKDESGSDYEPRTIKSKLLAARDQPGEEKEKKSNPEILTRQVNECTDDEPQVVAVLKALLQRRDTLCRTLILRRPQGHLEVLPLTSTKTSQSFRDTRELDELLGSIAFTERKVQSTGQILEVAAKVFPNDPERARRCHRYVQVKLEDGSRVWTQYQDWSKIGEGWETIQKLFDERDKKLYPSKNDDTASEAHSKIRKKKSSRGKSNAPAESPTHRDRFEADHSESSRLKVQARLLEKQEDEEAKRRNAEAKRTEKNQKLKSKRVKNDQVSTKAGVAMTDTSEKPVRRPVRPKKRAVV